MLVEHAHIGGVVCPILQIYFTDETIRLLRNTPRGSVACVSISTIDPEPFRNIVCVICLELEVAAFVLVPCGHQFCRDCLLSVSKCPICKITVIGALRLYPSLVRSTATGSGTRSPPALPQPQPSALIHVHPSTSGTAQPSTSDTRRLSHKTNLPRQLWSAMNLFFDRWQ
jgi:hypothetical protein